MDSKEKVGIYGDQLNQYNEFCNGCGKRTIPFIGRTKICPDCENNKEEVEIDPFGFEIREPTPEEVDKMNNNSDEITIPIDLGKLGLD